MRQTAHPLPSPSPSPSPSGEEEDQREQAEQLLDQLVLPVLSPPSSRRPACEEYDAQDDVQREQSELLLDQVLLPVLLTTRTSSTSKPCSHLHSASFSTGMAALSYSSSLLAPIRITSASSSSVKFPAIPTRVQLSSLSTTLPSSADLVEERTNEATTFPTVEDATTAITAPFTNEKTSTANCSTLEKAAVVAITAVDVRSSAAVAVIFAPPPLLSTYPKFTSRNADVTTTASSATIPASPTLVATVRSIVADPTAVELRVTRMLASLREHYRRLQGRMDVQKERRRRKEQQQQKEQKEQHKEQKEQQEWKEQQKEGFAVRDLVANSVRDEQGRVDVGIDDPLGAGKDYLNLKRPLF